MRHAHVDSVISCLNLSHVQNNIVGDTISSCISGGQRKRVSIGMELAAAPLALFLDEPTSGLDATAALSIMSLLKTLSTLGVTVVAIIHQPRPEILDVLDGLYLVAEGHQIYQGKASEIAQHFEQCGYPVAETANVADAVLDTVSRKRQAPSHLVDDRPVDVLRKAWKSSMVAKGSTLARGPAQHVRRISSSQGTMEQLLQSVIQRGAPWPQQVHLCLVRALKQQLRRKVSFILEISVGSIAGLLIGLSVYQLKGRHFQGIYLSPFELLSSAVNYTLVPQMGLLCSLAIGLAAAAPGVKVFGEESKSPF